MTCASELLINTTPRFIASTWYCYFGTAWVIRKPKGFKNEGVHQFIPSRGPGESGGPRLVEHRWFSADEFLFTPGSDIFDPRPKPAKTDPKPAKNRPTRRVSCHASPNQSRARSQGESGDCDPTWVAPPPGVAWAGGGGGLTHVGSQSHLPFGGFRVYGILPVGV